jgi:stress response protein SCP2
VRLVLDDKSQHELCRYKLDSKLKQRALIFSSIRRRGDKWIYHALGIGSDGKSVKHDQTQSYLMHDISIYLLFF